jgi:hypothetical protein
MKLKCICCDALARYSYYCAAKSPHLIDIELVSMGQHIKPKELNKTLQEKIDGVTGNQFDAILLCYGLCGQATAGLLCRDIPIIYTRAHDCITLCLGSKEEYKEQQRKCPGTIWYTKDYMERLQNATDSPGMGASSASLYDEKQYDAMVKRMGKERADRIIASMSDMTKHYDRIVFIKHGIVEDKEAEEFAHNEAVKKGWRFEKMMGNVRLIKGLMDGEWPDADYLYLKPGQKITAGFGDMIVKAG